MYSGMWVFLIFCKITIPDIQVLVLHAFSYFSQLQRKGLCLLCSYAFSLMESFGWEGSLVQPCAQSRTSSWIRPGCLRTFCRQVLKNPHGWNFFSFFSHGWQPLPWWSGHSLEVNWLNGNFDISHMTKGKSSIHLCPPSLQPPLQSLNTCRSASGCLVPSVSVYLEYGFQKEHGRIYFMVDLTVVGKITSVSI